MFQPLISFFTSPIAVFVYLIVYRTSFIWIPFLFILIFWEIWMTYRRAQFFAKQDYIVLEVRLPKEIFKSPLAMEFFIDGLYQTGGESNWYEKYWLGQTRPWFSLEMTSIGGGVHFFIWTRKSFRTVIEANLYSQYPGIEIFDVPDYTTQVTFDPTINNMWSTEFDLTKADAFPIKTYIEYGLDKDPKEEFKIDPLTPLIEFLGSLGREHQAWIQIILRAHKAEDKEKDPKTGQTKLVDKKWEKSARKEIDTIIKSTKGEKGEDGKIVPGSNRILTKGENQRIEVLERSISKKGFDVGIRAVYIAPKEIFSGANNGGIIGGITKFNSSYNGFKPARGVEGKYSLFPWKARPEKKVIREKKHLLEAYKYRGYFYNEFKSKSFVLNTEELATLYHFPGGVSTTPAFSRIGSKKSEAPSNLPI